MNTYCLSCKKDMKNIDKALAVLSLDIKKE